MNRSLWSAVILLSFAAGSVRAEEKVADPKAQIFLETLQAKLEHTARRANQPTSGPSASVIGLRGSKQEPLSKQLYWKGQKGPEPVNLEEVKAFRAAVEQARAGQIPEALTALRAFQVKFPASPLRPDVEETLHILSTSTTQPTEPTASVTKES